MADGSGYAYNSPSTSTLFAQGGTSSGGLSTAGQVYAGGAALSSIAQAWQSIGAARMQKQQAEHNMEMMKLEARYQQVRSDLQEARLRSKGLKLRGKQRAAYSAGGVNPDVGSAALVGEETQEEIDLDAQLMQAAGEGRAASARGKAASFQYRAGTAMGTGYARAGTSLLSGAQKLKRFR